MAKKRRKKGREIKNDLLRIALFIVFDALVFHEAVATFRREIQSLRFTPSTDVVSFLDGEWRKIVRINYIPIFSLAHKILLGFPSSPNTEMILSQLIDEALKVISSGVLLKHDLMGRIYHKLLLRTTGGYYATYYTSIPAAWILANLTVKTPNPDLKWDFGKVESIGKLKILDPACGSGTLLSTTYSSIKDRYILEREKDLNLRDLHSSLLENVLCGWDILDYATHLTLTTLALHNHKASFSYTNVYTLPVGMGSMGEIHLGSLDYLSDQGILRGKGFTLKTIRKGLNEIREEEEIEPPKCDIVIMNPPFSRSAGTVNVKFGYTKDRVMKLLNKKLREIGEEVGFKGIGQAGLGAYFILLGDKLLKQGGRISIVIPRGMLSGVSWSKIRNKLLKDYEIEYIVSNHDPGNIEEGIEPWNFSENTDLGEVLIVARKTDKPLESKVTTIVNLWNKPKNEIESLIISHQCIKARERKDLMFFQGGNYKVLKLNKEVGTVCNVKQGYLDYNFLYLSLFANPYLNRLGFDLLKKLPLIPMEKLTENLGVDRKQIETTFMKIIHQSPYLALWGHSTESIDTISLPLNLLSFLASKKDNYQATLNKAGRLLVAERIWTTTQKIIALHTSMPVLATMFWEVKISEAEAKILALWLNSTFGFLLTLGSAINNKGEWFNLKKEQLKNLMVLDVGKLDDSQIQLALNFYKQVKKLPFKKFSEEFLLASQGKGIKKQIDDFIIQTLGLNINLQPYYEMLSAEPVITLRRL